MTTPQALFKIETMDNTQTPNSSPNLTSQNMANSANPVVSGAPAGAVAAANTSAATTTSSEVKPVNATSFAAFPSGGNSAQNAKQSLAKILIVEDEQDAREMFVDLLESENYEVSAAVDGNDAIAKAAADKFDLILLDLVMPNKDGLETLQDIKSDPLKFGTPVVVVLTNISGDAAVEKAMELGAAGYRLKIEVEPEQLLKDVDDFLHGKKQDVDVEKVGRSLI